MLEFTLGIHQHFRDTPGQTDVRSTEVRQACLWTMSKRFLVTRPPHITLCSDFHFWSCGPLITRRWNETCFHPYLHTSVFLWHKATERCLEACLWVALLKDSIPSVLAVEISVVKCTFLPPLEKCFIAELAGGYFLHRGWDNFYKEGERARYACYQDFQAQHNEVTCTRNGWAPPPRCTRKSEWASILVKFLPKTICCSSNFWKWRLSFKNDLTYYRIFHSDYRSETSNQDFHSFK